MIEEKRPMCIMIGRKVNYGDALDRHGNLAFDSDRLEEYPDDPFWDACDAEWSKQVAEEDRSEFQKQYGVTTTYVKCLEPAVYSIHVDNGGSIPATDLCEFHHPRVRS